MGMLSKTTLPKAVHDAKEEFYDDDDSAFIKSSQPRLTKYDYILSVIEDYLLLEGTNFGMPPIAEYHVASDSLGIVNVEKIPISFA